MRSLATSFCTLMPILALLFFGGETLKDFAFALAIGVLSGAYSSIFIATPVLMHWKEGEPVWRKRRARVAAARTTASSRRTRRPPAAPRPRSSPRSPSGRARALTSPDDPNRTGRPDEFEDLVADLGLEEDGGSAATATAEDERPAARQRRGPDPRGPRPEGRPKTPKPKRPRNRRAREVDRRWASLAWAMMGIAIWHFAIFIPDRFWGGIVGSVRLRAARRGHLRLHPRRLQVPGKNDIQLLTALEGHPRRRDRPRRCYGLGVRKGNVPSIHALTGAVVPAAYGAAVDDVRFEIAPAPSPSCRRAGATHSALAARSPRCSVRRGLADPAGGRARSSTPTTHDPSAFARHRRRGRADPRPRRARVADRRPRRLRLRRRERDRDPRARRCATWAPQVAGSCRAARRTATAWPRRPSSGSRPREPRCSSPSTAAITAVDEVALARDARRSTSSSPTTTSRAPTACCRTRRSSIPGVAATRARTSARPASPTSSSAALLEAAGRDPAVADRDLDVVALATIADCVPLAGENRRLVRAGLAAALARPRREGLRALLRVSASDPAAVDEQTVGFRLAPRINAAGRMQRADAGVELLLTEDPDRAHGDRGRARRGQRRCAATSRRASSSRPRRRSRRRGEQPALRARRDGLAPGRDRHRRLAPGRAPPPPGRS